MAVQTHIKPAPFGAISVFRFVNAIDRLRSNVSAWNTRRLTAKELYSLSRRELDDIGISYADIPSICAQIK